MSTDITAESVSQRTYQSRPAVRRRRRPHVLMVVICGVVVAAWIAFGLHASWTGPGRGTWAAVRSLASWIPTIASHLPRNSGTAVWVTLLVACMALPGSILLRIFKVSWQNRLEHAAFAIPCGLAAWVPWTLLSGWALNLDRSTVIGSTVLYLTLSAAAVLYLNGSSLKSTLRSVKLPRPGTSVPWLDLLLILLILALCYLSLLGALSPEVQFDARWYHLGSAAHYVSHGDFYNIVASTHDPAMGLNPYQEILYTGFYALGGQHAAKVFAFLDLPLIALAIIAFGCVHLRSMRQGLLATLIFLAIPIASWSGSTASNDLPLALYTTLAIHMLLRWRRQPEHWSLAYLALFLAGFSFGVKALGLFTLAACLLIMAVEALRRRAFVSWSHAAQVGGWSSLAVIAACTTWWVRVGAMTSDPIFPLEYKMFPTPYWNDFSAETVKATYRHISLTHIPIGFPHSLLTTVTLPGPFQVVMGPLFLVSVPIVVLLVVVSRRLPTAEWILIGAFGLIWSFCWYVGGFSTSRYLLAVMPAASLWIVMGLQHSLSNPGLGRLAPAVAIVGVAFISLSTTQLFVPLQRGSTTPGDEGPIPYAWNYLYRGAPEASVQLDFIPVIKYIDDHVQTRKKIYDNAGLYSTYMYLKPEMYDGSTYGSPTTMKQWSLSSVDVMNHMKANNIGYLVTPAASMPTIERWPIYHHLRKVYESPDLVILFQVQD